MHWVKGLLSMMGLRATSPVLPWGPDADPHPRSQLSHEEAMKLYIPLFDKIDASRPADAPADIAQSKHLS